MLQKIHVICMKVSPRGMTQGAQNMFFGGVALLVSLATFIQGGKVSARFLETLSYRGRGLKLIICIQNFNLPFC
jgi:hypothetical protein